MLPNLSRTDGPAGGCDGIGSCLLVSYFGYETGACDALYGICFGIFSDSSCSSSSLGNALYLETDASFLLIKKTEKFQKI